MAGNLIKIGNRYNTAICEYAVDEEDDIQFLPTTIEKATGKFADDPNFAICPPMGSICTVGNEGGELLVYQLYGFGWKRL